MALANSEQRKQVNEATKLLPLDAVMMQRSGVGNSEVARL